MLSSANRPDFERANNEHGDKTAARRPKQRKCQESVSLSYPDRRHDGHRVKMPLKIVIRYPLHFRGSSLIAASTRCGFGHSRSRGVAADLGDGRSELHLLAFWAAINKM